MAFKCSGSDFAAIDDLSIQEAACRPNYFILPDIEEKLQNAKEKLEEYKIDHPCADPDNEDPDCEEPDTAWETEDWNNYWSEPMVGPTGHSFQVRFFEPLRIKVFCRFFSDSSTLTIKLILLLICT